MKPTEFNPFLTYSRALRKLFNDASTQKDPATWLYKNDIRTTLFMLEALTRLHKNTFDEKVFDKWNLKFKKLEDIFGEIDNFSVLENTFKSNFLVADDVIKYFTLNKEICLNKCNHRLIEKNWLNNKLDAFDEQISAQIFNYDREYARKLRQTMESEVIKIVSFIHGINYWFTKVEDELHEVRRKLRWLSIYTIALRGIVKIEETDKNKKYSTNYFTAEILNSPFNTLEKTPAGVRQIIFSRSSFLGLSYVINKFGKIKDQLLNIHQLADAFYVTKKLTKEQALNKSLEVLKLSKDTKTNSLADASLIIKNFILTDKLLADLIVKQS